MILKKGALFGFLFLIYIRKYIEIMAGINGVGRVGIRNYVAPVSLSSIVTNGLVLNLDASNPLSYSGTGTSWTDMSGNGNDATLVNGPTFNSANGGSIAFDGINDFARIAGNSESLSSITTYSFDIWLKASYSGNKVILEKGTNGKMIIQPDTSNSIWYGDAKMASINSSTIFNGLWKNYSVVQSSTNTMLYINGTLIYTASGGNSAANNSDILLMARSAAYPQAGNIGSFKVYNRVLSASEVLQNFDSTKSRFGFVSYTSRTTAFAAATGITDTTILNALNTFDAGLISNGLDTKMKALYPMVGGTANTHKFNFMDARDADAAFRLAFNGGWVHDSNGSTGNGTNAYATTYLNPSAQLNTISSHISYYNRSSVADTSGRGVFLGTGDLGLFLQNMEGYVYGNISNGAYMSQGMATNAKFYMINRNAYSYQEIRTNSVVLTSNTSNSNSYTVSPILINSYTTSSFFSKANCAFASIGSGLTDGEATTLYNLVQTLQTTLNRQV